MQEILQGVEYFLHIFAGYSLTSSFASLEVFTVVWLRSSFFWDMMLRQWVIEVQRP
jgi:hypothetical protein